MRSGDHGGHNTLLEQNLYTNKRHILSSVTDMPNIKDVSGTDSTPFFRFSVAPLTKVLKNFLDNIVTLVLLHFSTDILQRLVRSRINHEMPQGTKFHSITLTESVAFQWSLWCVLTLLVTDQYCNVQLQMR